MIDDATYAPVSGAVMYEAMFVVSGSEAVIERVRGLPLSSSGDVRLEGTELKVRVSAVTEVEAKATATRIAERFCDALSLWTGEHFSAQYSQLLKRPGEPGERLVESVMPDTWRIVTFRPENLAADVQRALDTSLPEDDILSKAGAYFRHALFLHQEAWRYVVPGSFHWGLLIAGAFLHYYKAVSIIVGEPGTDRDHQSRYRRFGISHELWLETEQIRKLRNAADVAHYTPDLTALERVRANIEFAKSTASKVVGAYANHVVDGGG